MKKILLLFCAVLVVLILPACGGPADSQPGATLTGEVNIGEAVSSAEISIVVSADGSELISVSITLHDLDCQYFSVVQLKSVQRVSIPITDSQFSRSIPAIRGEYQGYRVKEAALEMPEVKEETPGLFSGSFSSPTQASGSLELYILIPNFGAFNLGTFQWSASAE